MARPFVNQLQRQSNNVEDSIRISISACVPQMNLADAEARLTKS